MKCSLLNTGKILHTWYIQPQNIAEASNKSERVFLASIEAQVNPMKPRANDEYAAEKAPVRLSKQIIDQVFIETWVETNKICRDLKEKSETYLPSKFTTDSFLFISAPVSKS